MSSLIRTLIVDDSAFVRKVVRQMLSGNPFIDVVGMARDGEEALVMVKELAPDVVTCDLLMPRVDGLEFVRRQMAVKPLPILMLTSSPQDCTRVMEAMQAGAVDMVRKPTAAASDELLLMRQELVEKVKAAARITIRALPAVTQAPAAVREVSVKRPTKVDVVLIGVSTGGPQALRYLLPQFPADFPVPIAMVLHMPVGYTALFAKNLDDLCLLDVKEASDGTAFQAGQAVLARAGRHLTLKRTAAGAVITQLSTHPLDKPHRPAVDVLFKSAADTYGARVLAVVLTGMGEDGKEGAAWVKAQGGAVLTEAEESCIVYGMPRAVKESGLSDASYPLGFMARAICSHL